ncbi:hypothetical protein KIN20_037127 [Parelaphostrongylus tenuis]|uniref:Uncharacterized protein n=1 Tax=Parelaphostrongylus tenuis TaxID=148309 RepID=A0AAD5RDU6_PARTN|nr:hypothetical protein KIN20_037127 [Parelaphostrongylus tenuis]
MTILYEDCFVEVNQCALKIKNYYFPSKKDKIIDVGTIQVLWFEEQETSSCSSLTKMWGKSRASIYWALDVKRRTSGTPPGKYNIVLDVGEPLRPGFTVMDGESFMETMRCVLDYHVIIVDSINL